MALARIVNWADRQVGDIGALNGSDMHEASRLIIDAERLAGEIKPGGFAASHIFVMSAGHIFEAIWPKVSLSPWGVYDGRLTRIYRLDVPAAVKSKALLDLQTQWLNAHYDLFGVLGMGLLELGRYLGDWSTINELASKHSVWCSELGADYLDLVLRSEVPNVPPTAVDPAQIVNFLDTLCSPTT